MSIGTADRPPTKIDHVWLRWRADELATAIADFVLTRSDPTKSALEGLAYSNLREALRSYDFDFPGRQLR